MRYILSPTVVLRKLSHRTSFPVVVFKSIHWVSDVSLKAGLSSAIST